MIVIQVDGVQYGGFTGASVDLRLDTLSNTFSFDSTTDGTTPLPFGTGDPCEVFADGVLVLTGSIELVTVNYDSTSHDVAFTGRDKTGDLLDSSLHKLDDIGSGALSLAGLARKVIANIGADIDVVDQAKAESFNAAEDIESPEAGDNAFAFLEKYSRKRQVLLTSNAKGDLVLAKNVVRSIDASVTLRIGNPGNANNVIRGFFSDDSTGRFNLYRAVSQGNTTASALAGLLNPTSIADQGSEQEAKNDSGINAIRKGRQHILVSEAFTSGKGAFNRADWEKNIRNARGKVYSPEVVGFRNQTGDLWSTNTIIQVTDEKAGISAPMLINSVSFSNSISDGSERTILGLVQKDSYTLELSEPIKDEVVGVSGGSLAAALGGL